MNYKKYCEQVKNAEMLYNDIYADVRDLTMDEFGSQYHIDRCKALLRQAIYIHALLSVEIEIPKDVYNAEL